MAASFFGLEALVYMVKASFSQKPYRRIFMETFGATCLASPTDTTEAGRQILAEHPDTTGSLGIAISEAMEIAATNEDTNYVIGSVLNHVLLHQTIIGLETQKQMAMTGYEPDTIIGCVGGGSNYAGFSYPFMGDKLAGKKDYRFIAAEPAACPTLTKGKWAYDFGDTAQMTPLLPMYTLGHDFVPAPVHAGGLRYHGDAPSLCLLVHDKKMEAKAYTQNAVFDAASTFARTQGILPAPEPSHAIRAAIDEAIAAREANEEKVILFNLCGHGFLDMQAYDDYNNGLLIDLEFDEAEEARALAAVPDVPIPG
jgi:tryptophan synthase beta chain